MARRMVRREGVIMSDDVRVINMIPPQAGGTGIKGEAALRAAFPKASTWWIRLMLAFERNGGEVTFEWPAGTYPDLGLAIEQKLTPGMRVYRGWVDAKGQRQGEFVDFQSNQSLKSAATRVLTRSIKPWQTGTPRRRRYTYREITQITHRVRACTTIPDMITVIDNARASHNLWAFGDIEHRNLSNDLTSTVLRYGVAHQSVWRELVNDWLKCPAKCRTQSRKAR
jgi:hypothetical protein